MNRLRPSARAIGIATLAFSFLPLACSTETSLRKDVQGLTPVQEPPGGLLPGEVPQFVSVSFDDNFNSEGMNWAVGALHSLNNPAGSGNARTFDGTPARTSFYHNSTYLSFNTAAWGAAVNDGHETADHTVGHGNGLSYTASQWQPQVLDCRTQLATGLSLSASDIVGFRAPYLAYNDALFDVLDSASPRFLYDTSIQACWGSTEDGTNCAWPYLLDAGSSDAQNVLSKFGSGKAASVGNHPGIWEVPVSTLIVPPDSLAAEYGFSPGLRSRVQAALGGNVAPSFYEESTGKVAGLDVTLLVDGKMTKAEALATLRYSLDLRLTGNRAPLVFVAHTHVYASNYGAAVNAPNVNDRRALIEEFLSYALGHSAVRVRPVADIIDYMEDPASLGGCTPVCEGRVCGEDGCGGSCGECSPGSTCSSSGQCSAACVPSCDGLECGEDGCGGSCGSCTGGAICEAGSCVTGSCSAAPWQASVAYGKGARVAFENHEYEARWYTQNQRPDLFDGADGSGQPWTLGVACSGSCTPACSGLECGSDGCGGTCGTCANGESCLSGQCQNQCIPACSGLECGSDGCGGTCGTCMSGESCVSGQCQGASGSCADLDPWQNGKTYAAGEQVRSAGARYACKPWPYSGWCGAGTAYEPGVGYAWADAWTLEGSCD